MFLKFILPFDVRNDPYTYEWVMYRAIHKIHQLGLLGGSKYWDNNEERQRTNVLSNDLTIQRLFGYEVPDVDTIRNLPKFPLSYDTLDKISRQLIGPGITWAHTILERIPALEAEIRSALDAAVQVEAIFLWTNCASVKAVAKERGVPTIHHELGPLRAPYFRQTAYLDFEGVNGQTDAQRRWTRFKDENDSVPMLSREELLTLLSCERPEKIGQASHAVGVALQVPDDSNILAFSRGFDSFDAISTCFRYIDGRVLVRAHPSRGQTFPGLPVDWDESARPSSFLDRIEALVTINSSLAFEAMLLGKPTYVLGDSPFKCGSWDIVTQSSLLSEDDMIRWLNWVVFGYLIPFDQTFDPDYCRWRISNPSESEIYVDNFKRWTEQA